MRATWEHAGMFVLGVGLTVGFYEGRRLLLDTMDTLSTATDNVVEDIQATQPLAGDDAQQRRTRARPTPTRDRERPLRADRPLPRRFHGPDRDPAATEEREHQQLRASDLLRGPALRDQVRFNADEPAGIIDATDVELAWPEDTGQEL